MRRAVRPTACWTVAAVARRRQHSDANTETSSASSSVQSAASATDAPTGSSPPSSPSGVPPAGGHANKEETPFRTLYPRVRLRAKTQERAYKRSSFTTFEEPEPSQLGGGSAEAPELVSSSATAAAATEETSAVATEAGTQHVAVTVAATSTDAVASLPEGNEVQRFLDEVQRQVDAARFERNQTIPVPLRPEANSPAFRRIKRHAKMTVEVADPDYPTFARKDQSVELPPAPNHPWVQRPTPSGPHVVHGDGQIRQLGGTGQVDFDDTSVNERLPQFYRGLQHRSILQRRLPQDNGRVVQDAVIKHSFTLTGRGVFATHRIAQGETIMIVQSTARNVGVKGETQRLEELCEDILIAARDGDERVREFLHSWILTGQPSSLLEHWPAASTARVIDAIGGADVLDELELHPIHVARLAAIVDLNSFLVESSFAERKGMAYFPEAGFLNHSCIPNATYDIMPEHVFRESDYYLDEAAAATATAAAEEEDVDNGAEKGERNATAAAAGGSATAASTARADATTSPVAEDGDGGVTVVRGATTAAAEERNAAYFGSESRLVVYPDLTGADAPVYLFCCRAVKDIEPGEEILISYVPPQWSFDNRQYVLHDRYRFWCKCPKCAPTLDKKYARVPQMLVGFVILSILLQFLVFYQRNQKDAVDEDFNRLAAMSEEERLEELRARGINPEELTSDAAKRRKQQRNGLFELMEEERQRQLYEPDNRGYLNVMDRMNPLSEPPR